MNSKIIANGILRAVGIIFLILVVGYAIYSLQSILIYIVIALVIALIGKPLVHFFNTKLKLKSKTICVILTMLLFVIIGLGVFSLFIPLLISQSKNLSLLDVNQLKINLNHLTKQVLNTFGVENTNPDFELSKLLSIDDIPNVINSLIGFIGSFGIGFFSVLFLSFFFLKDGEKMLRILLSLIADKHLEKTKISIGQINNLLSRYFVGLIFQISILFIIYTTVLLLFGVENALIIAFLCALLNLIPYLGPVIGFVVMALLTMSSNISSDFVSVILPKTIYVLIGFLFGQLIDNFISQPLIFSSSVKSNPLEIFLVILISGTLFGVIGMVVAIPAYTVIKVILKEFLQGNKFVDILTKNL